jgi:hypothetical protein
MGCRFLYPHDAPPSSLFRRFDHPDLHIRFDAPKNMRTHGPFSSWLGEPRDRSGEQVTTPGWQVHAVQIFPETKFALSIGFWWLTPDRYGITEAEIAALSADLGRPDVALDFMRRHFDGRASGFRGAEELNLVPIGDRLGRRIAIREDAEYVVMPVRGRGVLVAAANFHYLAHEERGRVWPRIVASIRVRDESERPE